MGRDEGVRRDPHAEITGRILDSLGSAEEGEWGPPWISMAATGLPTNAASGARYRGVNIVALWAEAQLRGFGSARWASYRQWQGLGAQVRRGERGSRIVFYRLLRPDEDDEGAEGEERAIPIVRTSAIFNADQVSGYEDPGAPEIPPAGEDGRIAACEELIERSGAEIRPNAGRAFYDPTDDYIGLPAEGLFTSPGARYAVAFHELTHWTGHRSRLDRAEAIAARFGSAAYAAEELVAELGAAFLCAAFGLEAEPRADHAAYIKGWIGLLRDDERAIFTVASRASEAVAFLEGRAAAEGDLAQAA